MEKHQFDNAKFLEKQKDILDKLKPDFNTCMNLFLSFDEWKKKELERIEQEFKKL